MKFCALICELNPLTNGHKYIIETAKEQTGLPLIALMSGPFCQRGQMAILSKQERARLAIKAGADVCLELPFYASISVAENFAYSAVKILNSLKCIESLVFGIEWSNFCDLEHIAHFLATSPKDFNEKLKENLKLGSTFHTTLENTLAQFLPKLNVKEIMQGANNILAIEYLKALYKTKSKIVPMAVKRTDLGHNETTANNKYLSATIIRDLIKENKLNLAKKYLPTETFSVLKNTTRPNEEAFNLFLLHSLRNTNEELLKLSGEELNLKKLIIKNAKIATSYENLISLSTSKRYREPRIKRAILELVFNINKTQLAKIASEPICVKLLAIKKEFKPNIKFIRQGSINVIVNNNDYLANANLASLNLDLMASNTYASFAGLEHNHDLKVGTLFV